MELELCNSNPNKFTYTGRETFVILFVSYKLRTQLSNLTCIN